jgi:hypothetical protein
VPRCALEETRLPDSLNQRLATTAGRQEFDRTIAALIRRGSYKDAESILLDELARLSTPIAAAARASHTVELTGWDEINAECERLTAEGPSPIAVTAIGLDLSNYNDSLTPVWHDKEPMVEFAAYTDSAFGFSSATVDELLRVSEAPPTPWQGRMVGGTSATLDVSGLRALNSALLEYSNETPWRPHYGSGSAAPDEYVAFALGEWMRHLRFHEAVARHVAEHGLALQVPVLIGEHDAGPFIQSAVKVRTLADHRETTDGINRARKAKHRAEFDAVTEEMIDSLDEMRRAIGAMGFFSGGRKRQLIRMVDAKEALFLKIVGLTLPKPTWKMSDAEFQEFARSYRAAREAWGTRKSEA